ENGTWMVGRIPERAPVDPTRAQPGFDAAFRPDPRATCIGGFQALTIPAVTDRHYVFDADAGMLWAGAVFERASDAADGSDRPLPRLYLSNLFRIEEGRIRGIYSVTTRLPEEITDSGWARD